ncbi:hypothetical protein NDU88_005224 [Pleurodeles waltl]|uniref:Uncharacterized protein n=1 Tax=Pleurodeles waltl TaxID=8319 RepID=A0AAV7LKR5_PLEWA|nr:hypothetical protein NDU88_005224 [Pleurodeles waltl]
MTAGCSMMWTRKEDVEDCGDSVESGKETSWNSKAEDWNGDSRARPKSALTEGEEGSSKETAEHQRRSQWDRRGEEQCREAW